MNKTVLTIGVVADTHIPDRVSTLHPRILPLLQEAGVCHILHAGDISAPRVLEALRQAAPVTAVRGNRDIFAGRLNMVETLDFGGVTVALLHGHGGLWPYLWDKWKFWLWGYDLKRYQQRLVTTIPEAKVVVFGHTHYAVITWRSGKLLFNPGSASFGNRDAAQPAIGLLRIASDGDVQASIIPLEGYRIVRRKWVEQSAGSAS